MSKSYLFTANYKEYNFKNLFDEATSDKKVKWGIGKVKSPKRDIIVEVGDTVYIYYKNLPDDCDRIILKAKVFSIPLYDENDEETYLTVDDEDKNISERYKVIWLDSIKGIFPNDRTTFMYENLKEEIHVQGKVKIPEGKVLEKLEHLLKDEECSFKELKNYFYNENCDFKEYSKLYGHKTFKKRNNLPYLVVHHFIGQSVFRNYEKNHEEEENRILRKLIYNTANEFRLCPLCHDLLHNGTEEEIENLIIEILKRNHKTKNNMLDICNIIGEDPVVLLNRLYHIHLTKI